MIDVRLYSHAIGTHSRTPSYTDYYRTDKEIRAFNHLGRSWGANRMWGLDGLRDFQERRRWTIASGPNWLLNINDNTSEGTTRSSGNIPNGHSHGIYLTNRISCPCTVEIPYPLVNVNIRDGVFLHEGRVKLESIGLRSLLSPAVIAIHLDHSDEESFRKFKDLSNHLARVVGEPDDRGFSFWFIKHQRGQLKTPVKDSSLYCIDFIGKHLKPKFHDRDCIKFVVVIGRRDPPRPPYPPHPPPPSPCTGRRDPPHPPYPPPPPRNQEPFIDPGPTFYDGEEVLARWEDDKWYYKGRIARRYDVNNYYCVKDSTSQCDVINWEDIIRATDHYDAVSPDKRDRVRVLAPHPVYYWSYAPGRVIEAIGQKLTVRFYDNKLTNIEKWDVYPARNREKYLKDVEDIQQREKDWEGKEAVIRDESGVYRLGRVNKQIGCQPMYNVTWQDGQCGEQMSIHIYGTYNKTIKFKVGSYILALVDSDSAHFLPGQVRKVTTLGDADLLDVVFIDGRRSKDALSTDSYWMNEMAYIEAENEFLTHHPDSSDEEEYSR